MGRFGDYLGRMSDKISEYHMTHDNNGNKLPHDQIHAKRITALTVGSVHDNFKSCIRRDGTVDMDRWNELYELYYNNYMEQRSNYE